MRGDENAVKKLVADFFEQGKPVAAICHGPWMLVEAGVARGRKLTSWPTLQTDIRNAGGTWVDEEVVVDSGLVSSRNPGDIYPAFSAKIVEEFCEGRHAEQGQQAEASAGASAAAILDIDGTLVDTNYQHAIAWYRAFRAHGFTVQLWKIHRAQRHGGDQLVRGCSPPRSRSGSATTSAPPRGALPADDRAGAAFPGARELLLELKRHGHVIVLCSSAKETELMHYVSARRARRSSTAGRARPTSSRRSPTPISCTPGSRRRARSRPCSSATRPGTASRRSRPG